ncbi:MULTISPECIES: PAS domain S-box protein [Haloarcula]|uniref:PAS domain S-box protein n=1 Tax=Haloarcula TaxID=2237 RepID=UPI0023EC2272|nr:PAS domain S-box protein [Halomicroarcula sp. XH51]
MFDSGTTELPIPEYSRTDDRGRSRYAGLLGGAGLLLAAFQVPHLVADVVEGMGVAALLSGAVFPFLLAISIAAAGYWCWWREVPSSQMRRIDGWFVLGTVGMTVVSGAMVVYQLLEGAQLQHIPFVLLNFATAGGLGGIVVGWYDAQNRRRRAQLRVFREVVEHGGHAICLTDPSGTIEYVNPEFEAQTGYDAATAVGQTPAILRSGAQDDAFYADLWETILAGEVWHGELVNERRDGTRYHVNQTIAPITDDGGDIAHFVAINQDVTARKEYEAELERQNERLDEFASVVSHDLRNPLSVASGQLELERMDRESEHLAVAASALERMERLIDDMLTLARQGETVGETDAVSLRSVVEAAWKQVETPDANLVVETDLTVAADARRVQQLFENLFRNSVEHGTPPSRSGSDGDPVADHTNGAVQAVDAAAELTVTVGDVDGGFFVADTGPGLPDDARDRIFESGYSTSHDGTGLGLSIVRRIADAHGWTVTATNGADGGARFEIRDVEPAQPPETV